MISFPSEGDAIQSVPVSSNTARIITVMDFLSDAITTISIYTISIDGHCVGYFEKYIRFVSCQSHITEEEKRKRKLSRFSWIRIQKGNALSLHRRSRFT